MGSNTQENCAFYAISGQEESVHVHYGICGHSRYVEYSISWSQTVQAPNIESSTKVWAIKIPLTVVENWLKVKVQAQSSAGIFTYQEPSFTQMIKHVSHQIPGYPIYSWAIMVGPHTLLLLLVNCRVHQRFLDQLLTRSHNEIKVSSLATKIRFEVVNSKA